MTEKTETEAAAAFQRRRRELEARCRALVAGIKPNLPAGCGFTLLIFEYGDKGALSYISSGVRGDMVQLLREYADYLEATQNG